MTEQLYLKEQGLYEAKAKVLEILQTPKGLGIVLDKTIFYAQGGGQSGDTGNISNLANVFTVSNTIRDEKGNILHMGNFQGKTFEIGEEVDLEIDCDKRFLNSKIHSAGHLLDLAIHNLNLGWIPGRGYHFTDGPFVEYTLPNNEILDIETLTNKIQSEFDRLANLDINIDVSFDESKSFKGQPLRIISFGDLCSYPCGGTHVSSTKDLVGFIISRLKSKSGIMKINYNLA